MYLIDTNYSSQIMMGDQALRTRLSRLPNHEEAVTCVIVQGELRHMVEKSEQIATNLLLLEAFLEDIDVYPIDGETANIYGRLKTAIVNHFGPKERARRRHARISQLGFDENDLWIAAVAIQHELVIVSADSDFERMKEVWDLEVEKWI